MNNTSQPGLQKDQDSGENAPVTLSQDCAVHRPNGINVVCCSDQQNTEPSPEPQAESKDCAEHRTNAENVVYCSGQQNAEPNSAAETEINQIEQVEPGANEAQENTDTASKEQTAEPKKRCTKCAKKLGLTGGFPCRCGGTFCAVHRYSDRHDCTFDYREMAAHQIRRDNPVVIADKVQKM